MIKEDRQLRIGALIFPEMDQIDLTGPFEVLSRIPNCSLSLFWKDKSPIRDMKGLVLTPACSFAEAKGLDVLVVPGGFGQEALMDDEAVLGSIREQAKTATYVYSICTGALLCGAAGLLEGVRSTTHWMSFHLLEYFGAIPLRARVVVDGRHISAAGVTAGIDGALGLAALLRGDGVAQEIQLTIEYAPDPPFSCGTPETALSAVRTAVEQRFQSIGQRRLATAERYRQTVHRRP